MTRMIKILGIMAIAALAMSAVFASGAQAQEPDGEFTAGATSADPTETGEHTASVITGHQEGSVEHNRLDTDSGQTNCTDTGVAFAAEDSDGTAAEINVFLTYDECIVNGTNPFTFSMNGCHYNFNQPESVEGSHSTWTGTIDLVCPEENVLEIKAYAFGGTGHDGHSTLACNITVLPKNDMGHVVYHNRPGEGEGETPNDWLTLDVTISGFAYIEHGFGCANEDTSVTENGVHKSTIKLKGDNPNTEAPNDHDLWIGTHE